MEKEKPEDQTVSDSEKANTKDENTSSNTDTNETDIEEQTPETKIAELEEKIIRQYAEMENQRRRYEKERDDAYEYGGFAFAKETLNLIDNLERSKANIQNDEKLKNSDGFEKIINYLDIIYKKCPMSLYVSTKLINDAKGKSLKECLEIEYQLSQKLVYRTDFDNGVNTVLVTKDHNPQWSPAKIDQINTEELNKYFETHTEKLYL